MFGNVRVLGRLSVMGAFCLRRKRSFCFQWLGFEGRRPLQIPCQKVRFSVRIRVIFVSCAGWTMSIRGPRRTVGLEAGTPPNAARQEVPDDTDMSPRMATRHVWRRAPRQLRHIHVTLESFLAFLYSCLARGRWRMPAPTRVDPLTGVRGSVERPLSGYDRYRTQRIATRNCPGQGTVVLFRWSTPGLAALIIDEFVAKQPQHPRIEKVLSAASEKAGLIRP